jgi:hypothetical protein
MRSAGRPAIAAPNTPAIVNARNFARADAQRLAHEEEQEPEQRVEADVDERARHEHRPHVAVDAQRCRRIARARQARDVRVGRPPARRQARRERDAERDAVQQRGEHEADDAAGELQHAHPRRCAPDALGLDVVADDPLIRSARDVHPELQQQRRDPQPRQRRRERQRDDPRNRERHADPVEQSPVPDARAPAIGQKSRRNLHGRGDARAHRGEQRVRVDGVRCERGDAVLQHDAEHGRPHDLDAEPERA